MIANKIIKKKTIFFSYGSRDDESREEIPDPVESRGDNGGYVEVGGESDGHHAIEGEVTE